MSTSANATANNEVPPKRSRGRPRSTPQPEPQPRLGIVSEPRDVQNLVEMSYDNVAVFKKMFSVLKSMNVKEINIAFDTTFVRIFGIDHLEKNLINIKIVADKLTHYYCEYPISITLDTKNLEKISQKIDKNYDLLSMILRKSGFRQHLVVVLNNQMLSIDETHIINLIESDNTLHRLYERNIDYNLYPVKFELPTRYFKKLINDISSFGEVFTIEQVNSSLQFTYKNINNTIKGYNICKDSRKINLTTTLTADDIFSVSVQIDYIKSLSNSLLSEKINIYADSGTDLVFNMSIDDGTMDLLLYVTINRFT